MEYAEYIFWGAATVLFLVVEGATLGLAAVWFALGSLFALISAALGAPPGLQITVFVVISIAALILTRPLAKKFINSKRQATNADRIIGKVCVVTGSVNNLLAQGEVLAEGKRWSARAEDSETIEAGESAVVLRIEGVKLIIKRVQGTSDNTKNEESC